MTSFAQAPDPWSTTTPAWGVPVATEPEPEPDLTTAEGLAAALDRQRRLLEAVATGKIQFKDNLTVENEYEGRAGRIRAELRRRTLSDPFPWRTLSDWWNYCSTQWSTYKDRRSALSTLLYPVTEALELTGDPHVLHDGPASAVAAWQAIEVRIAGLKDEYVMARELDDYQDVGRRSREILIDAVNLVWDPSMCPAGQEHPQRGNAVARFEQIVTDRLGGSSFEQLRGWFKKTWDLANRTTHSGTAARMSAFASGQAALVLARTLHLLAEESIMPPVPHPTQAPSPAGEVRGE